MSEALEEPVLIVPYDPAWPARFEAERQALAQALDGLVVGIEHFGSTSVPGLPAKPVIDILVLVEQFAPEQEYVQRLEGLGYTHHGWHNPEHFFLCKGTPRSHHLHIILKGSAEHLRHVAFRDYLRTHPADAQEYGRLKTDLAERFGRDREGYTEAKTAFIQRIERALGG